MSAAKRDPRRNELAKYLDAYRKIDAPDGDVFEQAVWCVLARNGSREQATRALEKLRAHYVDMNELRVAKPAEIAGLIKAHVRNDPERVAALTRAFLRAVVRDQHQMSFDFAEEMSIPELRKFLIDLGGPTRDVALAMAIHFCRKELEEEAAPPSDEEEGGKPRAKGGHDLRRALDRLRLVFTVAGYGHADGKGQPGTLVRRTLALLDYAELPPAPEPEPEPEPAVAGAADDLGGEDEEIDEAEFDDDDEPATRRRGRTTRRRTTRKKTVRKTAARKTAARKTGTRKTGARKAAPKKKAAKRKPAKSKATPKKKAAKRKPAARKSASKAGKTPAKRGGGTSRPKTARKTARKSSSGVRKSSRRR